MIDGANLNTDEDCCSEQNKYKEKLAFHAKLFECIHDGILAFDKDYVITYWNTPAENIFGWSAEELIGHRVQELYQAAVPDYIWESSLQKLCSEDLIKGQYSVLRKNGQMIYIDVNMKVLRDQQGLFNGAVASFRDYTERKEYELTLKKKEMEYLEIIDGSSEGSFIADLEKGEIYYSTEWKKKLDIEQMSPQEATHVSVTHVHPDDRDLIQKIYRDAIKNKSSKVRMVFRAKTKKTGYIWVLGQAKIIYNQKGKPIKYYGTHTDITELKNIEQELLQSKTQSEFHRKRLDAIIEVCPSAILLVDAADKKITYVNQHAVELHGINYTGVDLHTHVTDIEISRPDGTPYPFEELPVSRALNYGEYVRNREMTIKNREGKRINLTVSAAPLNNAAGELSEVLVIFEDISEQKKLEKKIDKLNDDLISEVNVLKILQKISSNIIQNQDDAQNLYEVILDAAIGLTQASKGNFKLVEEEEGDLKLVAQQGFSERYINYFNYYNKNKGTCAFAYKTKSRVTAEDITQSPIFSGTPDLQVILDEGIKSIQSTPLISRTGRMVGVLSTHYATKHRFDEWELRMLDLLARQAADVIERIFFKKALIQSNKQSIELIKELRKVNENKNKFINMLSHEIRNPLASIMMSLSLLEMAEPGGESARTAQQIAKRQAKQLADLVDDLMDVSRITTNKIRLKKTKLNLNNLIVEIVEENRTFFIEKELLLEIELPQELIIVDADPVRIKQVIQNLLQNSAKFTKKDQKTKIILSKNDSMEEAIISVQDNGIGIKPEILPELFEPFVQVNESLDRTQGGLGLGLSIVKGMVELHGGSVTAYSDGLGKGAQFTIRLPIGLNELNQPEVNGQTFNKGIRPLKILVIDDIPDVAEIICALLNHLGHNVISAFNGIEGIKKAKEYHPDIIFCDIGLPDMTGFEVAEYIQNDEQLKDIYLIALSGYAQLEDIEHSKKSGFNLHLAKPIDAVMMEKVLADIQLKA